jgi:acyl carrier protein
MAGSEASADTHPVDVATVAEENLLHRFGFSSIEALEYLLAVEEEFGITLEDEELSEETLASAGKLADRVLRQIASQDG